MVAHDLFQLENTANIVAQNNNHRVLQCSFSILLLTKLSVGKSTRFHVQKAECNKFALVQG